MADLIDSGDPTPFERINGGDDVPLLVICDHASNAVPGSLGSLGVDDSLLATHIAWDIGARRVSERIVERAGGRGVICGVSRLVIDCNRPVRNPTLVPEHSDGVTIPANIGLSKEDVGKRIEQIYLPYHLAIAEVLGEFAGRGIEPFVLSVHSCSPKMNGFSRPWAIGVAHSPDEEASRPLFNILKNWGEFEVGDNEPYAVDEDDYSILAHGMNRGLKHALVEIRQDQVADEAGAIAWGDRLSAALSQASLI
jgi:predicted N-formylglutamate amidohydrolase